MRFERPAWSTPALEWEFVMHPKMGDTYPGRRKPVRIEICCAGDMTRATTGVVVVDYGCRNTQAASAGFASRVKKRK